MPKITPGLLLAALLLPAFCRAGGALTIQTNQAQIKTIGGIQAGAWNLWSHGEWGDYVSFAKPGTYTIRVRCFGSPADGAWPEMAFCIDGHICETVTVATNRPAEYAFKLKAEAKGYRITVSFLNDALTKTEDRNLYLRALSIEAPRNLPAPVRITAPAWRAPWAREQLKLEEALLAQAAAAIETNRKSSVTLRVLDATGRPVTDAGLVVEQTGHDFLFGGNIFMFERFEKPDANQLYADRFREIFNYATIGFYWSSYEPQRSQPTYAYTDKVVAWCQLHHIRMKGHPLLWACEYGIPPWSKEQPPAEVRKKRVTDIMTRYAGKIEFWEVVNEPAHLPGLEIDEPYRWAREANPQACLIVNDFNILADGCPPFYRLLQKAIARGVPFDGIGIQAHEPRAMRFPLHQVWKFLDQYAGLGRPIHITEFTPASGGQEIVGSHVTGKWDEAAQAEYAVKFYTVCFAHPAVAAITWWDLSDANSWLPGGGLLRKDFSPKPAYVALKQLIHEQWMTKKAGKTDSNGRFSFRGFRGQYVLRITPAGTTIEQPFHVGPQDQPAVDLVLPAKPLNQRPGY